MGKTKDGFQTGYGDAAFKSKKDAFWRALWTAGAALVAVFSPVPAWGKLLIFVAFMFLIGVVVQIRKPPH